MHPSAVAPARTPSGVRTLKTPAALVEIVLSLLAVVALLPAFAELERIGLGRDQRYASAGFALHGLPPPTLPALCRQFGAAAEAPLSQRLCPGSDFDASQARPSGLPAELSAAWSLVRQAFAEPLRDADAQLAALRAQQREGVGDLRASANAIAALEAELAPFMTRFALDRSGRLGPVPLLCALREVEAAPAGPGTGSDLARANAVLLLGAAFDGHAATPSAGAALLPAPARPPAAECQGQDLTTALAASAALMTEARQWPLDGRKNEAMRALLATAGWQWAGWMLLGLALLVLSRRPMPAARGVALALSAWGLAAWLGRVPWPLAADRAFEPARPDAGLAGMPAGFVWALWAAAALCLMLAQGRQDAAAAPRPQTLASRLGYPGLVVTTGVGWLLLLDLSATGHAANRYLGLYHQGHLWLAMLLLGVLAFLRQPLARALGWSLAMLGAAGSALRRRLGGWRAGALLALAAAGLAVALALALSNLRQLTSEIGRVWLILGAAWFFFLRGGPLAERLARSPDRLRSLLRYVGPLLFVGGVLVAAMLLTRDMGPLLIAAYGAGAFLAAAVAMWQHQRTGRTGSAYALAVLLFAGWIAAISVALFRLGPADAVTAARLESLAAPLASGNDQLALVAWFQQAAPAGGYGIGAVPWCGYAPAGSCGGVPAQIHSDYSFTALVGAFGWTAAWALVLGCAFWLHRLVRHHGRVTRGEPRLLQHAGRIGNDDQAFLSWVALAWVVLTLCQLGVTVAGNLGVLPLTGVTLPFVSFGMSSLLVNVGFLGLALNVDLPPRGAHG